MHFIPRVVEAARLFQSTLWSLRFSVVLCALLTLFLSADAIAQPSPKTAPKPTHTVVIPPAKILPATPLPKPLTASPWWDLMAGADIGALVRSHADARELAKKWPILNGFRGEFRVVSHFVTTSEGQIRRVRVYSPNASWGEYALGVFDLLIEQPLKSKNANVFFTLHGPAAKSLSLIAQIPMRLQVGRGKLDVLQGIAHGALSIEGLDLAQATRAFPLLALAGNVKVNGRFQGPLDNLNTSFDTEITDLAWRDEEVGRVAFDWTHMDNQSWMRVVWGEEAKPHVEADLVLPLRLDARRGQLHWLDDQEHTVRVRAPNLSDEALRTVLPIPLGADFDLDVSASARGSLDTFRAQADVRGTMRGAKGVPLPVVLRAEATPKTQTLQGTLDGKRVILDVALQAPLAALRRTSMHWGQVPIRAELRAATDLDTLSPYFPRGFYDPKGLLSGSVRLAGQLSEPDFSGGFEIRRGELTLVPLTQRLRALNGQIILNGSTFSLRGVSARSGLGYVSVLGSGYWRLTPAKHRVSDGIWSDWSWTSSFQANLKQFPVIHPSLPYGVARGSVNFDWSASTGQDTVKFTVGRSAIQFSDQEMEHADAIPHNNSIQFLYQDPEAYSSISPLAGKGALDLTIDLSDKIHVYGNGTDLQLSGQLRVLRDDREVDVQGGLEVVPGGTFDLFENPFRVRRGTLSFQGSKGAAQAEKAQESGDDSPPVFDPTKPADSFPLDPVINFTAYTKSAGTHVLLRLKGPARRPSLVLLSAPALPEYRILTLLITGRVDAVDDRNGDVRRRVSQLVARFHNPSLARQLYDRLGVDKLGFGFGSSVANPILTVGKQINRQLFVETVYHHNAPPDVNETEVHAEYRLTPYWTFDSVYGDAGNGSLGLFWQTTFGGRPGLAPPDDWIPTEDEEPAKPPEVNPLDPPEIPLPTENTDTLEH